MREMADLVTPTAPAVHAVAIQGFASRLRQVSEGDWDRPTPCTEWDVRGLVHHVVGANVRYEMLLRASPLEEVEATRCLDHLGNAPVQAFETTADAAMRAFAQPAVLDGTYRHVTGVRTGRQLLAMRIYDIGVHTWDLAVSIGTDPRVDEAVVDAALTVTSPAAGESECWSPQDRLLVRSGRRPDWGRQRRRHAQAW